MGKKDVTRRILFLIAARGGSKGLPRKNLAKIGGLSLIGYKARAALRSSYCSRLVISSDDAEMIAEGCRHGAEAPFVRPADLASDEASSDVVVLHALDVLEQLGDVYDAVMLLEPSSPFATPEHFDRAVELYSQTSAALVLGMRKANTSTQFIGPLREDGRADRIVGKLASLSSLRRQDIETEYTMNGALYLIDRAAVVRTRRIYGSPDRSWGIPMDEAHSWGIDTALDLALARCLLSTGAIDASPWRD